MAEGSKVDWRSYAEVYDLMAANNPAYQNLIAHFKHTIADWCLAPQSVLAELGAGTGNFSIELARTFPLCEVVHLDADAAMNRRAASKAAAQQVGNLRVTLADISAVPFQPDGLSALVTVHTLYAFPQPREIIVRMLEWLKPGGYVFACDLGRVAQVLDWAVFLFRASCRRRGLWRTVQLFYQGRVVTQQNRLIARAQRAGVYWTHTPAEFRAAFDTVGFEILTAHTTYRGNSDLIVARKPLTARKGTRESG